MNKLGKVHRKMFSIVKIIILGFLYLKNCLNFLKISKNKKSVTLSSMRKKLRTYLLQFDEKKNNGSKGRCIIHRFVAYFTLPVEFFCQAYYFRFIKNDFEEYSCKH